MQVIYVIFPRILNSNFATLPRKKPTWTQKEDHQHNGKTVQLRGEIYLGSERRLLEEMQNLMGISKCTVALLIVSGREI